MGFGPSAAREGREASEPPALASLIQNPTFLRAPSVPASERPTLKNEAAQITLGSMAEAQRSVRVDIFSARI